MLFNTLIISRARSRRSYVIEGREEALARRSIVPSVRSARSAKFAYVNFSLVTCCGGAWHTRFHERRAGEPDDDNQRHKTPAEHPEIVDCRHHVGLLGNHLVNHRKMLLRRATHLIYVIHSRWVVLCHALGQIRVVENFTALPDPCG